MAIFRKSLISCRRHIIATYRIECIRKYSEASKTVQSEVEQDDVVRNDKVRVGERVLTGLQPTGALHLGNYFGCVQRCVHLQDSGADLMVMVADMHALTSTQAAADTRARVLDATAALLAAGLDPTRTILFAQSAVSRHAELCWLLTCVASQARLTALPQYRERGAGGDLGVLAYPVLQAADVLLYGAERVPVGADQLQHLQVAAQIVRSFHHRYERVFVTPRALVADDLAARLRSLRDPTRKMSKSDTDPKSRILLTDDDDVIRRKVRKAVTDFTPEVTFDPERRPGVSNLVALHCLAADLTPEEAVTEAEGLTTARYKDMVAESLVNALRPLRERARELRADEAGLRAALRAGAARARSRADVTWRRAARAVGIL